MVVDLLLVFVLNVVGSCFKTIQTVLIMKKYMKPVYVIILIDSVVYMTAFKLVANGDGYLFIAAYALGRVVGVYVAEKVEEKLAIGLQEVTVYAKPSRAFELADSLREEGYSVTTIKGYGAGGKERFGVILEIQRKEMAAFRKRLTQHGFDNATLVVRDIKSVEGHIEDKVLSNYK